MSAAVAKEHHAYRDEVDQRAGVIENSSIVITPVFVVCKPAPPTLRGNLLLVRECV